MYVSQRRLQLMSPNWVIVTLKNSGLGVILDPGVKGRDHNQNVYVKLSVFSNSATALFSIFARWYDYLVLTM